MIKPVLIALLSMPLLAMPPAHGQSADDALFEQANAAFERADYASARAGWETLANKGQSRDDLHHDTLPLAFRSLILGFTTHRSLTPVVLYACCQA